MRPPELPEPLRRVLSAPWRVLTLVLVVQWLATLAFALTVRHNGFLFFQGGDQAWFWTTAVAFGHGHIPASYVGYGWSLLLAPLAAVLGPDMLRALPGVVLLQQLVLVPVAIASVYEILRSVGGRRLGYLGAAVWVAAPFAAIPLFDVRYHDRYVEQLLPQVLGLTAMSDYPSLVFLLAAAAFLCRAIDDHRGHDGAIAGLLVGFAIGIKPANAVVLAAPLLALAVARRPRQALAFTVALAPALVTLALWKHRGLGFVPLLAFGGQQVAAGESLVAAGVQFRPDRYVHLDWGHLYNNILLIREFFWSVRLVEWLPVAGAIAVARRSGPKAVLLLAWLGSFVLLKGSAPQASVEDGTFWRLIMPGFPPLLIFLAALPLLRPGVRSAARATASRTSLRAVVVAAAVLGVAPVVALASFGPQEGLSIVQHYTERSILPIDSSFRSRLEPLGGGRVRLSWDTPDTGSVTPSYTIFRVNRAVDWRCEPLGDSRRSCIYDSDQVHFTAETAWVDRPPKGVWTYRVGLSANWQNEPKFGDVVMLGAPSHYRSR